MQPLDSPLFSQSKPGNTKKYLAADLFVRLARPVIEGILKDEDMCMTNKGYLGDGDAFKAMKLIFKKRRANHVQSWRLSGKPLPLRYDTPTCMGIPE